MPSLPLSPSFKRLGALALVLTAACAVAIVAGVVASPVTLWRLARAEITIGERGAIVLANSDDDDGDGLPDNWPGGDFDYLPGDEPADVRVNAWPDPQDLATLVLRRPALGALPKGSRVVLRVSPPDGEHGYFAPFPAHERLCIFAPTQAVGDELVIQPGDEALLGPTTGPEAVFAHAPARRPIRTTVGAPGYAEAGH